VPLLAAGMPLLPQRRSRGIGRGLEFVRVVLLATAVSALLAPRHPVEPRFDQPS
jgi:hypothetical protein